MCCSPSEDILCTILSDAEWHHVTIDNQGASNLTLPNPCPESRSYVTGLRYNWRQSPCALEQCAIYSVENELPAPPFHHLGYIAPSGGHKQH